MARFSDSSIRARASAIRNVFALLLVAAIVAVAGTAPAADVAPARAPLDLNRATAEELATLPGIGAAKAAAILAAREAQGGFSSVDQLEAVRGIGPALMAKLRPLVAVGGGGAKAPAARTPAAGPGAASR